MAVESLWQAEDLLAHSPRHLAILLFAAASQRIGSPKGKVISN